MSKIVLQKDNVQRIVHDDESAKRFEVNGYKRITPSSKQEPAQDLEEMTLEGLRTHAKEQGLTGVSALKKEELFSVLKEAQPKGGDVQ